MRFGVCGTMLGRDSFRPSAIRRKIYSTMLGGLKTPPANAATLSRVPFYPSDTVFAFGDPGPAAEGGRQIGPKQKGPETRGRILSSGCGI